MQLKVELFASIHFQDESKKDDAPSQAHLQGTQSRHTKANLAKEPALCQRTGNTLRLDTDPHSR